MTQTRRLLCFLMLGLLAAPAAHAQTTSTSVQLTWTAPGDDGNVGTAAEYDLRYSTATITANNFGNALRWSAILTPGAPGTSQTTTVTGLNPSTTYFFAIKTADDAGNWSVMSNVVSKATLAAPDVTPPASLSVNVTTVTDTTATLSWSATGDDSLTGTAASYDARFSTSPITLQNWNQASQATNEPIPAVSGTAQTFVVRNLLRQTTYYFAVRVADETGNVSGLSNVPSSTTTDTRPPSAILNLTANFFWLSWHSTMAAIEPRAVEVR